METSYKKILDKLDTADALTLEAFNEFVTANIVRNNFLPIMEHLCKLIPKQFTIDEFADKTTQETTSIQFHVNTRDEYGIDGRVGYYPTKKIISYELWWGGECYCHLYRPIEMINMISILMDKVKIENGIDKYKLVRKTDCVIPWEI
jgi:hypothetical protein